MGKITANVSYGLELECVKLSSSGPKTIKDNDYAVQLDHSIRGDSGEILPRTWPGAGYEIITKPHFVELTMNGDGTKLSLNEKSVIDNVKLLASCSGHVNSSCGLHVHLGHPKKSKSGLSDGLSHWSPDEIRTMLIIGQILEPRLLSMVHASRHNNTTCQPIAKKYTKTDLGQFYPVGSVSPNKYQNLKRYCWLNLTETVRKGTRTDSGHGTSPGKGTIEIRFLGETDCPEYISIWVIMWLKIAALVAYASPTMAISQVCYSDFLEGDFFALTTLRMKDEKIRHKKPETSSIFTARENQASLTPATADVVQSYSTSTSSTSSQVSHHGQVSDIRVASTSIGPALSRRAQNNARITSRLRTVPTPVPPPPPSEPPF